MRLEVGHIFIRDMQQDDRTRVEAGVLFLDTQELVEGINDERPECINVDIARPGEQVRICPAKDVIEPRVKVAGNGGVFPGFVSGVETAGSGRTHVLKGAVVVTCGPIIGFQEGIIDMSGPGADYTPFSKAVNLVLTCDPKPGVRPREHEEALRLAGLKAAAYLAEAARRVEPDEVAAYETLPITRGDRNTTYHHQNNPVIQDL
jgi:glycine reductase